LAVKFTEPTFAGWLPNRRECSRLSGLPARQIADIALRQRRAMCGRLRVGKDTELRTHSSNWHWSQEPAWEQPRTCASSRWEL